MQLSDLQEEVLDQTKQSLKSNGIELNVCDNYHQSFQRLTDQFICHIGIERAVDQLLTDLICQHVDPIT